MKFLKGLVIVVVLGCVGAASMTLGIFGALLIVDIWG